MSLSFFENLVWMDFLFYFFFILCSELIEATYISRTVTISEYETEWQDETEDK